MISGDSDSIMEYGNVTIHVSIIFGEICKCFSFLINLIHVFRVYSRVVVRVNSYCAISRSYPFQSLFHLWNLKDCREREEKKIRKRLLFIQNTK